MASPRPSSYCKPGEDDPSLAKTNMIVYSHPGEGKTVLWGTGGSDVLFLVSDPEGIISARSLGHSPHSVQVSDYDELQEVYQWLSDSAEPKRMGFKWVVWDSLTLFQDRVLIDDIMVDAVADNPKQEEFVPSKREYLININRLSRYVRQFVDLPWNLGISCHAATYPEISGDGTLLMPQLQGKNMPSKVSGYMNVVGYMHKATVTAEGADKGKVVQRLQVRRAGKVYAKDRFDVIGGKEGWLDRPTLPKIDQLVDSWRARMKTAHVAANPSQPTTKTTK